MLITRNRNFILLTDSYKLSHWRQYPPNTRSVYSYMEPRNGNLFPYVVNFGTQYYLREFFQGPVVTNEDILEADDFAAAHFNDPGRTLFNRNGWKHIVDVHGGHLPIRIFGLDEGVKVPVGNALFTIENTDPDCWWLTNVLETILLKAWYTTTVATLSHFCIQKIGRYLFQSSDDNVANATLRYMLQDFGSRGTSSEESAALGAMAHLVNGFGTDTMTGIQFARQYYDAQGMPGFSVAAMEHSTITSWPGRNETSAYRNALARYPEGILSIVCDSYDQRNAISEIFGGTLKMSIIERGDRGGVVVIRLDSGDPLVEVPVGIELMMEKFGYIVNSKGYRVLPPYIRALQGDGINYFSIGAICQELLKRQISVSNLACFGMGGALLQKVDRDTCGFAIKASNIDIDGTEYAISKQPKTDPQKASKAGRLAVHYDPVIGFRTLTNQKATDTFGNRLKLRLHNGKLYNQTTFEAVRENALRDDYSKAVPTTLK